ARAFICRDSRDGFREIRAGRGWSGRDAVGLPAGDGFPRGPDKCGRLPEYSGLGGQVGVVAVRQGPAAVPRRGRDLRVPHPPSHTPDVAPPDCCPERGGDLSERAQPSVVVEQVADVGDRDRGQLPDHLIVRPPRHRPTPKWGETRTAATNEAGPASRTLPHSIIGAHSLGSLTGGAADGSRWWSGVEPWVDGQGRVLAGRDPV